MKTHLNFATRDLSKSVDFYRALLNAEPAKRYEDYALFLTDDPGLELALDKYTNVTVNESAHYGIAAATVESVNAAVGRLKSAGLETDVQIDDVCCYARQTKVWTTDPDGRRWEFYTVLEETEERDNAATQCCAGADEKTTCCAR